MILYNTIVGLAAEVELPLVAQLLKQFAEGGRVQPEGFALASGITGFFSAMNYFTRIGLLMNTSDSL